MLRHRDLTDTILGAFYCVYRAHGYGYGEAVYTRSMVRELKDRNCRVAAEARFRVEYKDEIVGAFKVDILVNDLIVVEIKAASALAKEHEAQVLNYLKASRCPVALLLNFGPKPTFRRMVGAT